MIFFADGMVNKVKDAVMTKMVLTAACAGFIALAGGLAARAQVEERPVGAEDIVAGEQGTTQRAQRESRSGGFAHVVTGSGALGIILWLALFGTAGAGVYFAVDCAILIRPQKIVPPELIENVTAAMSEGDVLKALQSCENEPGAMANILTAGFSHVEEGFDIIQEAISMAADLETERLTQRLTWLSVVANISPMLGLLGTVQGMIRAFANLAAGAPDMGVLATNISQALWTTATGLVIAVPCVTLYYTFRNNANRIVLRMEAITMELIKDLRNVEVVEE